MLVPSRLVWQVPSVLAAATLTVAVWNWRLGVRVGVVAVTNAAQRAALVDLYLATDGVNWSSNSGWKDNLVVNSDPCNDFWVYISCDGTLASSNRAV